MSSLHCRPNDAVAGTPALLCNATSFIQGLWRQLGCPRRQAIQCFPEVALPDSKPASSPPFSKIMNLPETLQAQVLEFSGNAAASSLSIASQHLHESMWQSGDVWQARLASIGATSKSGPTEELIDEYRWRLCGIDSLCRRPAQSNSTRDCVIVLENARRAVKALRTEDAPFVDLISMTLADLIRWYDYTDESAHRAAKALVQDVIGQSYLFTSDHIRDVSSAFDSACSLRELILEDEFDLAAKVEDDLSTFSCMELLHRITDLPNECDDIPDFANCSDDEACERVMELLRSLPEGL